MQGQYRRHAVVIGASIGGLTAARVLSDHFDRVTILERDGLAAGAEPRKAVPQGRHAHALLGGGMRAISGLFPGFVEELAAGGGLPMDFNAGRWYQAGGYRTRNLVERSVISASRPFIEDNLRRRTRALPNVTIETGVNVVGLICDGGRVRGVQLTQDDVPQSLDADFVVDCSGRASSAAHWLQDIGYPSPEVVDVHCNVRYATLTLRRHPDDLDATFADHPRVATGRQARRVRHADRGRPLDHDHRFQLRCGSSERLRRVPRRRRDAAIVRAARPVVARRTAH